VLDEFADEDLRDRTLERGNPRQYVSGGMLGTFDFCPRCFEYVFLEGVKREVTEEVKLGSEYHRAMKEWVCGTRNSVEGLHPVVAEWVTWTLELEGRRAKRPGYHPPVMVERKFRSPDLLIEGHPDRVDWQDYERRTLAVVEYKTGHKVYERAVKVQLGFYGVLVSAVTGLEVERLVMVNPRLKDVRIWDFDEGLVKMVARAVARIRYAVAEDKFPRRCTVGKFRVCHLCNFDEVLNEMFPSKESEVR